MKAILVKLATLQTEYRTADEDKRADIQQKYKDVVAQGLKLEPKLIEAAEKAYQEAPNADKQIVDFLVHLLSEKIDDDDYEPAAKIGKLLVDNKCGVTGVLNLAGIAAFRRLRLRHRREISQSGRETGLLQSGPEARRTRQAGRVLSAAPSRTTTERGPGRRRFAHRDAKANSAPRAAENHQGRYRTRTVRGSGPEHRGQLHQSGAERILQERRVPPRAARVHGPGRRSHGHRRGRARLHASPRMPPAEPPRPFPRLAEHGQDPASRQRRLAVLPLLCADAPIGRQTHRVRPRDQRNGRSGEAAAPRSARYRSPPARSESSRPR